MRSLTGRNELRLIASQLSERDLSILHFVRQHQYANTIQLRRRFFHSHATLSAGSRACARVLDRLYRRRVLTRLERRVGGIRHGSSSFVWCLDVVGDRLSRKRTDARWRPHEPSAPFVDHTLAIAEAHVQLYEAATEGLFLLREVGIEAEAWRAFVTPNGAKSVLKPDLKVTIGSDNFDDHWYVEIDRGTESLPVLLRKCRAYEDYRRTGRAQSEHGVFPRVLWVMPDRGRVERLRSGIDADADLPDRLFTCIASEGLVSTLRSPP